MKKLVLLLVVSSILLSSCSQNKKNTLTSNQNSETYQTKIDSLLSVYDNNTDFMGSLALSHKGKTIYSNTVGFSDINTKEKPNANTKYRIGSISKMYTAVLIFKAVEENKLQLEQTIDSYFPNVKNAGKITIAQLLHHRSGIPSFTSDKSFMEFHTQYKSPDEMLAIISNYNSDFKPNTAAAYSNSNYFLLSQILVRLYNMSYEDLFLEKIIKPLGLQNTFSGGKININNNDCYSYVYTDKWTEFPETDMSIALGGGSIVSTPTEVNTFLEALLTGKLISSENLALMKTIKDNHGMGIFRYKINDREGFGHRGRLDAFRSTAIYFPDEELSFTLATNASKTDINTRYTEIL